MSLIEDLPLFEPGNSRRNYVVAAGYVLVALMVMGAIAGPTDDPGGSADVTPTPTPTVSPTASPTPAPDHLATFESTLRSDIGAIDVDYLEQDGAVVFLEYRTTETTVEGIASEMGRVAGAYASVVEQGWRPDVVEVTVLDAEGSPIGFWRVETEWAVAYNSGEISGDEYSERILATLESNE